MFGFCSKHVIFAVHSLFDVDVISTCTTSIPSETDLDDEEQDEFVLPTQYPGDESDALSEDDGKYSRNPHQNGHFRGGI